MILASAAPSEGRSAPSRRRLLLQSLWPSFRRTLRALFSAVGLPLFVLAIISAVKFFEWADLINLRGFAERLIGAQENLFALAAQFLSSYGLHIPVWVTDAAFAYFSVGNTMARAEKSDLLGVQSDFDRPWSEFFDGVRRLRFDLVALAMPQWLRHGFVRLAWPLAALYRLHTPFVVEGPGPGGDLISSSVPRRELVAFAKQVSDAIGWKGQTVFDSRQILFWHAAALIAGGWTAGFVLSHLP